MDRREQRIDKALEEVFPRVMRPCFVGAGAEPPGQFPKRSRAATGARIWPNRLPARLGTAGRTNDPGPTAYNLRCVPDSSRNICYCWFVHVRGFGQHCAGNHQTSRTFCSGTAEQE